MQGKTINGFILQKRLGVGGMAEVWYAENEIHKPAAVKILNEELSHNTNIMDRFRSEAEIMVKLNHPNIREVYGYGSIDGRPAIVMEYLDGSDLKEKMKRGQRFTDDELRKWWGQLVSALNYTHQKGIVHRDIKPGNIFVDTEGNIKLLDFGIAKVRESISATQTGQKLGTLMYMSPEQVRDSKHIDYRTDVYSLAVTFVQLITGKKPYDSDTSSDFDIMTDIVTKPLDLDGVPMEWRNFLAPYLEKDPEKRPALRPFEVVDDEGTMVSEVSPVSQSPTKPEPSITPESLVTPEPVQVHKSKKGLWIGLAAVAVVAVVLLLLLKPMENPEPEAIVTPETSIIVVPEIDTVVQQGVYEFEDTAMFVVDTVALAQAQLAEQQAKQAEAEAKAQAEAEAKAKAKAEAEAKAEMAKAEMPRAEAEAKAEEEKASTTHQPSQEKPAVDETALINRVNKCIAENNGAAAIDDLKTLNDLDPNNVTILFTLGTIYGDQYGRAYNSSKAISYYQQALKIDPNHHDSNYNLGAMYVLLANNKLEEANKITGFSKAENDKYDNLISQSNELLRTGLPYLEKTYELEKDPAVLNVLRSIYVRLKIDGKY